MYNSRYRKTELANGVMVVTEEIPHVRSVALGVWLTVGSRDEDNDNNGISHFIEHMLFKGTKHRNAQQIAESLEAVGGSLDAFTTKELTCYNAHCLDEHVPLAVDVIADLLSNSLFNEDEIKKEKYVVLNEINHYKDTPDDIIFDYFYEHVFRPHPLGYHIYGNEKNVKSFSRTQLMKFLHQQYVANRLVISAAGNLDHEQLCSQIAVHFGGFKLGNARSVNGHLTAAPQDKDMFIDDTCTQAHICLGSRGYSYHDEAKFPFLILNTYLGGGMSSILFQKIREEYGLVYTIYAFYEFFIDCGIWGIYCATEEKNIEQTIGLVKNEFTRLKENYITDDVLTNTKNQLKGALILGLENTTSRMSRLAKNEIYLHDYYTLDDIIKKIDAVTIHDVAEIIQQLFYDDDYFTTIIKPKS